jgi:hypothetical protein
VRFADDEPVCWTMDTYDGKRIKGMDTANVALRGD